MSLRAQSQDVTISGGETKTVNFVFKASPTDQVGLSID